MASTNRRCLFCDHVIHCNRRSGWEEAKVVLHSSRNSIRTLSACLVPAQPSDLQGLQYESRWFFLSYFAGDSVGRRFVPSLGNHHGRLIPGLSGLGTALIDPIFLPRIVLFRTLPQTHPFVNHFIISWFLESLLALYCYLLVNCNQGMTCSSIVYVPYRRYTYLTYLLIGNQEEGSSCQFPHL